MRPIYVTQTGVGFTQAIPLDPYIGPFQLSLTGLITAGTPTFSAQYTVEDPASASAHWLPITGFTTVSANTSIEFSIPCRAVRLSVTVAGTVEFVVIQSGQSGV